MTVYFVVNNPAQPECVPNQKSQLSETPFGRTTTPVAFVLLTIAIVAAVSVYLHKQAGYTMPPPWPDETHFLYQSAAVAEHNSLFSPELNPNRDIMWQPPGYFLMVGGVFKLFGISLQVARYFSLFCIIAAFGVFCFLCRALWLPWPAYVLGALFWVNSQFVACGNIARMEAPLILTGLLGTYLVVIRRPIWGVAVLAAGLLLHFNSLFFAASAIATVLLIRQYRDRSEWQSNRAGWIAVGICVALWLAYAVYVAKNWDGFVSDMGFQFHRKGLRNWVEEFISPNSLRFLVFLLPGAVWAVMRERTLLALVFTALSLWALYITGGEMWYRIFYVIAVLFAVIVTATAAQRLMREWGFLKSGWKQAVWVVLAAMFVIWPNLKFRNIDPLWEYPRSLSFYNMGPQLDIPYNEPADKAAVLSAVRQMLGDSVHYMEFNPTADAFMFTELRSDKLSFSIPLFCERRPDFLLYHDSPTLPPMFHGFWDHGLSSRGIDSIARPEYLIHENSTGEKWYAKVLRK